MNDEKRLIEVLFKSGASVRFHCSTCKINSVAGEMTGYSCTGIPSEEQILHINIEDVDCVRVVPEK